MDITKNIDFKNFKEKHQKVPVEEYPNEVANHPLVSVSVQTYQHSSYIQRCLEGILMQKTNFPYEILLGEDASTDGTREICIHYAQKYPDKIRLFLHHRKNNIKINQNATGRFNLMYNFYQARGKYIALCPGDDYWTDPLKLQKQVEFLEEYIEIGIVHTKYEIRDEIINSSTVHERNVYNTALDEFQNYLLTGDMRTLTVMFRSKFLKDIEELWSTELMMKSPIGDRVIFLTIASKSQIAYMDEITGVYRKYLGQSATRFSDIRKKFELSREGNKLNLFLMSYLNINNTTYYLKCKQKLLRANFFLFLFKIPLFRKFYVFLYDTIGLGGYKNSGYY